MVSDCAINKSTATATKTFRFCSICEYVVDQRLENHEILYMNRQTDKGEHKIEFCIFRLVTPCVSARRDARYCLNIAESNKALLSWNF